LESVVFGKCGFINQQVLPFTLGACVRKQ
jgi:hypothetical protein